MTDKFNMGLFLWINSFRGLSPIVDSIFVFFSEAGPYLLLAALFITWFKLGDKRRIILIEVILASILGLVINLAIGLFYFHPRPFMLGLCTPLIHHVPETSFPSDHATILFAASIYLIGFRRWIYLGSFILVLAFLTSFGRVFCGVHFPLDIAGSLLVGALSACIVFIIRPVLAKLCDRILVECRKYNGKRKE